MATTLPISASTSAKKSTTTAKKPAAKKATAKPKLNPDGTPNKINKKPYKLSAEAVAKRKTSGAPQYTALATQKDSQNASKFFAILKSAPKKMEKGADGKTRRVIVDTNMRIMARQVLKNIRTLQDNAKNKQSPNKAASDNLQSFVTLYGKK